MNILVFSRNAWNNQRPSGNTLSNWFSGWDNTELFHITTRNEVCDASACSSVFIVSEVDMLKNLLSPEKIGKQGIISLEQQRRKGQKTTESLLVDWFRNHPSSLLNFFVRILWKSRRWQNRKFQAFFSNAKPDIFFSFLDQGYMLGPLIQYVKKFSDAKIVLFAADDVFTHESYGIIGGYVNRKNMKDLRECAEAADVLFGASPKLCDEYSQKLAREFLPLYKGCAFKEFHRPQISGTIRLVYAGNLYYNRAKPLAALVDAMEKLNRKRKIPLKLDIYTTTSLDPYQFSVLEVDGISKVHNALPYDEVQAEMNNADLVVFAESFMEESIRTTRLSFSTKIIDCLQSGAVLLAIGPPNIASIEYVQGIPGAVVITDENLIYESLSKISLEADDLARRALAIREYATMNHHIHVVQASLQHMFETLLISSPKARGAQEGERANEFE